jgi:hypothetical protein
MLIAFSVKLFLTLLLTTHLWLFNRKRDQDQEAEVDEKEVIELGMHDVTEIDNKGFRYIL